MEGLRQDGHLRVTYCTRTRTLSRISWCPASRCKTSRPCIRWATLAPVCRPGRRNRSRDAIVAMSPTGSQRRGQCLNPAQSVHRRVSRSPLCHRSRLPGQSKISSSDRRRQRLPVPARARFERLGWPKWRPLLDLLSQNAEVIEAMPVIGIDDPPHDGVEETVTHGAKNAGSSGSASCRTDSSGRPATPPAAPHPTAVGCSYIFR